MTDGKECFCAQRSVWWDCIKGFNFVWIAVFFLASSIEVAQCQACPAGLRDINQECGPAKNLSCTSESRDALDSLPANSNDGDLTNSFGAFTQFMGTQYRGYIEFDLESPRRIEFVQIISNAYYRLVRNAGIRVGNTAGCTDPMCGRARIAADINGPAVKCDQVGRYVCIDSDGVSQSYMVVGEVRILVCDESGCPEFSSARDGSSAGDDCMCNTGYFLRDSVCIPCFSGTYKGEIGNSNCTGCAAGKHASRQGATACTDCAAGTYSGAIGSHTCVNCTANTYSTVVGATSDECQQCPVRSSAQAASDEPTDCRCDAGYSGPDGGAACIQCVAAKYKNTTGSATCSDCTAAQYAQPVGEAAHAVWQMCRPPSEVIQLSAGVNVNVKFLLHRVDPCTLLHVLKSVGNWTRGDHIRVHYGGNSNINPAILRFIGNSSQQKGGLQARAHWSPVNIKHMHDNRSEYIITVNTGPLYLKLDAYETS